MGLSHGIQLDKSHPNVIIADRGCLSGLPSMQNGIFQRGPPACAIDAMPSLNLEFDIILNAGSGTDHRSTTGPFH